MVCHESAAQNILNLIILLHRAKHTKPNSFLSSFATFLLPCKRRTNFVRNILFQQRVVVFMENHEMEVLSSIDSINICRPIWVPSADEHSDPDDGLHDGEHCIHRTEQKHCA